MDTHRLKLEKLLVLALVSTVVLVLAEGSTVRTVYSLSRSASTVHQ